MSLNCYTTFNRNSNWIGKIQLRLCQNNRRLIQIRLVWLTFRRTIFKLTMQNISLGTYLLNCPKYIPQNLHNEKSTLLLLRTYVMFWRSVFGISYIVFLQAPFDIIWVFIHSDLSIMICIRCELLKLLFVYFPLSDICNYAVMNARSFKSLPYFRVVTKLSHGNTRRT